MGDRYWYLGFGNSLVISHLRKTTRLEVGLQYKKRRGRAKETRMGKLEFRSNSIPSLGVELELGLVDAQSLALSSSVADLLAKVPKSAEDRYKPELMQSCIEINTGICNTVDEAKHDLTAKLTELEQITDQLGLRLWWGATHPFSLWKDQSVTPTERYRDLVNLLQEMARRLVTFGLHVHIGVDSGDKAVMICDRIMQHLPTLSIASPWLTWCSARSRSFIS